MKKARGSFTVEAALIMPVILGVIVTFIYIAMYCHDRCIIEYVSTIACERAVYEDDPEKSATEYVLSKLPNSLMCGWETDVTSYSDESGIFVEVEASTPVFGRTSVHKVGACKHFLPRY